MAEISWYKTGQSEPHERNIRACRFVVDRTHKPCGGHLSLEQPVVHSRVGNGRSGENCEYSTDTDDRRDEPQWLA